MSVVEGIYPPLRAGVWRVKLIHKSGLLHAKFLQPIRPDSETFCFFPPALCRRGAETSVGQLRKYLEERPQSQHKWPADTTRVRAPY
jgi:hypothetical protein